MSLATQFAGAIECADHHDQTDFGFAHGEAVTPEPKPAVRAKGRAADWQRQLARAFLYVHGRAQTPEEAAELERLYEATLAEGPDFTRTRDKSEFKDAPELNLDRNAISKMMVTFYTMTRNGWAGEGQGQAPRPAEPLRRGRVQGAGVPGRQVRPAVPQLEGPGLPRPLLPGVRQHGARPVGGVRDRHPASAT